MLKKWLLGILVLSLVFIGLSRLLGIGGTTLEHAASIVAYPFLVAQKKILAPYVSWSNRRAILNKLLKEYEEIVVQRDLLSKRVIELSACARYLDDIGPMRDYLKRYVSENAVHAPVLVRNFGGQHFFLIDAGENFGIKKDMVALSENSLIGKVIEVYPSYSKVLLITDPTCKVAALCASNGVKGIHEGFKKGATTLNFVDHRDEVMVGDLVLSSGEGGLFPRGFALGTVTHSDSSSYGRSIVIQPSVNLQRLEYCTIVSNTIAPQESTESSQVNIATQESGK